MIPTNFKIGGSSSHQNESEDGPPDVSIHCCLKPADVGGEYALVSATAIYNHVHNWCIEPDLKLEYKIDQL